MGELAGRTADRRTARSTGSTSRTAEPARGPATEIVQLQRAAGNRATAGMLQRDETVRRRGRGRKRRGRKGARPRNGPATNTANAATISTPTKEAPQTTGGSSAPTPQAERPQGWGAWLGGLVTSGLDMLHPSSADEGDDHLSGERSEGTSGSFTEEDDTPIDQESLLGVPEISITLSEGELKHEVGGAEVEGSYELKELLDGYEGSAKIEVQRGTERTVTKTDYRLLGGMIVADFSTTEFVGERASAKAKGTLTSEKAALRAEASAFSGFEHQDNAKVKLKVGSEEVATFEGSAGYTVGHGGELKGHVSFDGGKVRMGTKGALSYGVGTSWEYRLEIDSPAVAKGLWHVLSSWASWLSGVAHDLDEALTDDDGEPIRIF